LIFIPGNIPSLKNSKTIGQIGKGENKRRVLLPSKTVKKYLQAMGIRKYSPTGGVEDYKTRKNIFRESVGSYFDDAPHPLVLGFNFVRDTQRKFDFINVCQISCDLLVAHGFIPDDDMNHLIPMPMKINGSYYSVCKDRPGVWLKIIRDPIEQLSLEVAA